LQDFNAVKLLQFLQITVAAPCDQWRPGARGWCRRSSQ